jgi:hypothetical protein
MIKGSLKGIFYMPYQKWFKFKVTKLNGIMSNMA